MYPQTQIGLYYRERRYFSQLKHLQVTFSQTVDLLLNPRLRLAIPWAQLGEHQVAAFQVRDCDS